MGIILTSLVLVNKRKDGIVYNILDNKKICKTRQGILFILFMALASNFANSMDNRNTLVERAISTIDNHNYGKSKLQIY